MNFPQTHLSHCATPPRCVSLLLKYFADCLHRSPHLMVFTSDKLSLTALSSSLLPSRRTYLCRIQKLFNNLMDLHLFCPHLSNINTNVHRLFTRPFNISTNIWRQNNSTERQYKLLSFNFRMTLHYCVIYFSRQLEQFPSAKLLLKTPLSVRQLTLTLILTLTLTLTLLH